MKNNTEGGDVLEREEIELQGPQKRAAHDAKNGVLETLSFQSRGGALEGRLTEVQTSQINNITAKLELLHNEINEAPYENVW